MLKKITNWLFASLLVLSTTAVLAQEREVRGKVIDDLKEPLPGVTVLVDGFPGKGTATDFDGNYKIKVPEGATTLSFRYIGLASQKLTIPANNILNVTMKEDVQTTTTVVVQAGFGRNVDKIDNVGKIETISGKSLEGAVVPSFDAALQGRAPGLQVTQASGVPGGAVSIRVRGTGSVSAGSEPLYIVDGVPITTGAGGDGGGGIGGNVGYQLNPLADFNPNDIESIEVLKDAAATAIYGSRGSNGVVLITTKRGKAGKTQFQAGYNTGFSNPTNMIGLLDGPGYIRAADRAYNTSYAFTPENNDPTRNRPAQRTYITQPFINALDSNIYKNTNTNWLDQLLNKNAQMQEFTLSGSGGSERTTFYAGLSYRDDNGVMRGNRFQRFGGRFTIDNTVNERLKVGVSTAITYTINNLVPTGAPGAGGSQGGFGAAQYNALPIFPIYYPDSIPLADGRRIANANNLFPFNPFFNAYGEFAGTNIALTSNRDYASYRREVFRNISNLTLDYQLAPGLKFRSENGIDYYNSIDRTYLSRFLRVSSIGGTILPTASSSDSRVYFINFNTNNFVTYDKDIDENNNLSLMGGTSYQESASFNNAISAEGFPNDQTRVVSSGQRLLGTAGNESRFSFLSFYSRANYKLKERYLAQASLRYDGSSRFGSNSKFGLFYGVGLGWIVSEESFLKDISWLSLLKVRASYGETGNAAGLDNFQSFGLFSPGATYGLEPGLSPQRIANPNLTWEKANQFDASVEFGFFKNRLEFSITYYNRLSRDMLLGLPIPSSLGVNDRVLITNIGRMLNAGWEFTINTKNIQTDDFKWSTDFNITFNQNTILDLGGLKPNEVTGSLDFNSFIGGQVATFFMPKWAGIATEDDPNGRWKKGDELIYRAERDANGNLTGRVTDELIRPGFNRVGVLDSNRVPIFDKPIQPLFFGGITNTFRYKNFDLNVLVTYTYGNYVLDEGERLQSYFTGGNNLRTSALADGSPNIYYRNAPNIYRAGDLSRPSYNVDDPMSRRNTTRFLHDASYVRLKTISLGYTLPESLLKRTGLRSCRFSANIQNALTFTRFPGWDPEVVGNLQSAAERNLQQGRTLFDFPQVQVYSFGVNVGF